MSFILVLDLLNEVWLSYMSGKKLQDKFYPNSELISVI